MKNPQIPGVLQGQRRGCIDRRLSGEQTGKETHDSGAASQGAGQKKNTGTDIAFPMVTAAGKVTVLYRNDGNDVTKMEEWRAAWAEMVNRFFGKNGLSERVTIAKKELLVSRAFILTGLAGGFC